jgi:GNAT superfamily N-acetyltransferase
MADVISVHNCHPSEIGEYASCIPPEWGGPNSEALAYVGSAALDGRLFVARVGSRVVGILAYSQNVYSSALSLGPICVAQDFRQKGVAKTLLHSAEKLAKSNGLRRVFIDYFNDGISNPFMPAALNKQGYSECGRVGFMHSETVESIIYSKPILSKTEVKS